MVHEKTSGLVPGAVLALVGLGTAGAQTGTGTDWQALARADLQTVHETIVRAHPGAIDAQNPGFRVWMEEGYRDALALVPRVHDYNSMLDAVRHYVAGFQDGHLVYSDNARTPEPVPLNEAIAFPQPVPKAARVNGYTFKDGVLWIRAANFDLSAEEARSLEGMLAAIRRLKHVRAIVFDTRGNHGGDSEVGGRIFLAAAGRLKFDRQGIEKLPRVVAQWRVSDVSLATAEEQVARDRELYGAQGADRSLVVRDGLKQAQASGQPWFEQWDGPESGYRLERSEVSRRKGHLSRFSGRMVLLTDAHCVSACLDFADYVRLVPGAVHAGHVTSADSIYIDVGFVKMPSGNSLMMPLKVWRNRVRGNNEPLVPDVPFSGDMNDDAAVEQRTLELLK